MNLVIMPVYELEGAWGENYPWFVQMGELCAASFRKNMANVDDVVILHNEGQVFEGFVPMFYDVFEQTYNLWKKGHNLFFTDADSLCVRPVKMFGAYQNFQLFSQCVGNRFEGTFPAYMLSGSRYFPRNMNEGLWDVGREVWAREKGEKKDGVFGSHWDYEQYVWNHMFFAQPGVRKNWEAHIRDEFNLFFEWEDQVPNASILSYNTSATWRGQSKLTMEDRLQLMKDRMPELVETDGEESLLCSHSPDGRDEHDRVPAKDTQ